MTSWPRTTAAATRLRAAWNDYWALKKRHLAITLLFASRAIDPEPLSQVKLRSYARGSEDVIAELKRRSCAMEAPQ